MYRCIKDIENKRRIAIIGVRGYPYSYSGYETFVRELVERLVVENIEITVYCHRKLFLNRPSLLNGIKLVYIPSIETKSLSQFIHSLLSTIHACFTNSNILLYVNSANGPFGIIAKLFNKKTIINVDGLEWKRPKWNELGKKYFYISSKLACKIFDYIVTDAEEMRKIYLHQFNKDSQVITYGANIKKSIKPDLIRQYGIEIDEYYLIVGRFIPDNNWDLIIEEFISTNSNKKLIIAGDVPYNDAFSDSIQGIKDDRLIFAGHISDQELLCELYHNCYTYFHGHEYGGTNPTLLDALAFGCSILALDTVFSREVLDNKKYGQYFTKKRGSLASKINIIEENYKIVLNYRKKSRDRIVENYTWEKIVNQYRILINNI